MDNWQSVLNSFIKQSHEDNLKYAHYPGEWDGFNMKVSFGMGSPARVPWIGFTTEGMTISKGIYPVYLYYKESDVLILAYGISETEESPETWPADIINNTQTIESYFDKKMPRYGDSFIFKTYKIKRSGDGIKFFYDKTEDQASDVDISSDLNTILDYYRKVMEMPINEKASFSRHQGIFYMEKQLEDFIIHNWENTELGKKYDLIIKEGELLSQQYKTDIGNIDILAKDKKGEGYVIIELKKDQTSDDTIGQIARYMAWIREEKGTKKVKGVIIAGKYDKKLDYALRMINDVEVFIYEVNFNLNKFIN